MIDKTIDPARVGLSKSLMTTPCERKAYYSERVRDSKGRRPSFPMPERVLFGRAIDAAHAYVVWHDSRGIDWTVEQAARDGVENARRIDCSEDYDADVFAAQVHDAMRLFVTAPEGLVKMREHYPGLRIQGDNGQSLRADDLIGTPDYMDDGVIDVKTSGSAEGFGKRYGVEKFVRSPEMPIYALLFAAQNGELPRYLAYQVCVRQKSGPSWQWIEVPATGWHVELGRAYANRWRKGLAVDDPDLFAFDTTYCGDCPFAGPVADTAHAGCPVGQIVHEVASS